MDPIAVRKNRVQMDCPPDRVIVGVDIGMTRTGVAICSPDRMEPGKPISPFVIQRWPSVDGVANKVPTLVAYRAGDIRIISWGFACPSLGEVGPGMGVKALFKFLLDENRLRQMHEKTKDDQYDIENVRGWLKDFLTALHGHVVAHLEGSPWLVDWNSTKIEYIFSLPTSWKDNDSLAQDFERIVKLAFKPNGNCSVNIGLTEGEASAVCTAKRIDHRYKDDDVLLVCDAGGGSTDICILKVAKTDREAIELVRLGEAKAIYVGSVYIDTAFEEKVEEELRVIRQQLPELQRDAVPKHVAQHMANGRTFQGIKTSFGTPSELRSYKIRVPGLPNDSDVRICLTRSEIKAMFDTQINEIFKFIDAELGNLRQSQPNVNVSYLVLSGGLGSSKYVQDEIITRYERQGIITLAERKHPDEPPLAVCKGLVLDRMQRICHGTSVLRTRSCRASYGVLFNDRYDKNKHSGRKPVKCPLDGKNYVTDQIDWFIHKGETIREDVPIVRKYTRRINPKDPSKAWSDTIVTSRLPSDCLPNHLGQGDSREVCRILSDLGQDIQVSNSSGFTTKRRFVLVGKEYWRMEYDLRVFVEQENLRFEIRVNGEGKSDQQTATAQWIYAEGDRPAEGTESDQLQGGCFMAS